MITPQIQRTVAPASSLVPQSFRELYTRLRGTARGTVDQLREQPGEVEAAWERVRKEIGNGNISGAAQTGQNISNAQEASNRALTAGQDKLVSTTNATVDAYGKRLGYEAEGYEKLTDSNIRRGEAATESIVKGYSPLAEALMRKGQYGADAVSRMVEGEQAYNRDRLATMERLATRPPTFMESLGQLAGIVSMFI